MHAKAPWHLWLVGTVATLFDGIGAFDFLMTHMRGAPYMASAGMPAAQIALYQAMPIWAQIVWGIGTLGAFAASVLLLLRRRLAYPTFAIALAAFAIHLFYLYAIAGGGAILGPTMAMTSAVIAVLLLLFLCYARAMSRCGVLR